MSNGLNKYIKELYIHIIKYECKDLNGRTIQTKQLYIFKRVILFIFVGFISILLLPNGFPPEFINIYANILAILVGLLTATMLFGFESLHKQNNQLGGLYEISINNVSNEQEQKYRIYNEVKTYESSKEQIANIQNMNYNLQYVYFTGYNIVLCTITLFILLISILIRANNYNPFLTEFIPFHEIRLIHIWNFILGIFSIFQRIIILYIMVLIMKYTLYATYSLVQVMTVKMRKQ